MTPRRGKVRDIPGNAGLYVLAGGERWKLPLGAFKKGGGPS